MQGVVKGGYEVKVGRSRAFCPFSQIDIVRTENPGGARRPDLHVPHHRVQGRRPQHRRVAPRRPRGRAAGARRGSAPHDRARRRPHGPRGVGARVRCVRRSRRWRAGTASRLGDGVVAHRGRLAGGRGRRRDHREGAAGGRGDAEDRARPEATRRGSVDEGGRQLRGRAGASRARDAAGGVRRVRRTRAGRRGTCACVHVPAVLAAGQLAPRRARSA